MFCITDGQLMDPVGIQGEKSAFICQRCHHVQILATRTRPGAELVPMGSAGAKAMAIVLGTADIYLHSGGQYEWDSAAPVAVARAAGFHASRIDGRELTYNQADLLMPDILVCLPALAGGLLDAISSAQASEADDGQR